MNWQRTMCVIAVPVISGMCALPGLAQEAPKAQPQEQPKAAQSESKTKPKAGQQSDQPDFSSWDELVKYWMTPRPYKKEAIIRIDDNYALPHIAASFKMKVVREEGDTVWLVGIPPEDPESVLHKLWLQRQVDEADWVYRADYFSQPGTAYFLDFKADAVPPPFMDSLRFERASSDLPDTGKWQMGFTLADMNEDGHLDIVLPPQRKASPARPAIFIGDGNGGFKPWRGVRWPDVGLDYGGVAAADFDSDGHQDIAIAIHFGPQYILFGDGKGGFPRVGQLPAPDRRISSRAVTAADFNGDGTMDLAFLAEVDFDRTSSTSIDGARTVWIAVNKGSQWDVETDGLPTNVIGDVIRSADMNGDGRPDLVVSSSTLNHRQFVYLNGGDGPWKPTDDRGVLSAAYHFDVEPGDGEVFATFLQFRMIEGKNQARNGLVRYPLTFGDQPFVNGTAIVWEKERANVFFRLAVGDVNGDGRDDLVAARKGGGLEVYTQSNTGDFVLEEGPEFDEIGRVYDIRLIDLDGDGLKEIIASYASYNDRPGGIGVWFTRRKAME